MAGNKVRIDITVDAKKGTKEIQKFGKEAKKATTDASDGMKLLTKAAALGAAAFAAMVAIKVVNWVKDQADQWAKLATSITDVSTRLGIGTDELQEWQYIAEQSGISAETFNMGLQRMVRRISEAANGTGEAVNALRELNLNAKELEQLPIDQQLEVIANRMREVGLTTDQVRVAMKLLDSEGVVFNQIFARSQEEIGGMRERVRELGGVLSGTNLASANEYRQAVVDIKWAWRGFIKDVGPQVIELMKGIANAIAWTAKKYQELTGATLQHQIWKKEYEDIPKVRREIEKMTPGIERLKKYREDLAKESGKPIIDVKGNVVENLRLTEEQLRRMFTYLKDMSPLSEEWADKLTEPEEAVKLLEERFKSAVAEEKRLLEELNALKSMLEAGKKPVGGPPPIVGTAGDSEAAKKKAADAAKKRAEEIANAELAAMRNTEQIRIQMINDEATRLYMQHQLTLQLIDDEYNAKVAKYGELEAFELERDQRRQEAEQVLRDYRRQLDEQELAEKQARVEREIELEMEKNEALHAMATSHDEAAYQNMEANLARTSRFWEEKVAQARAAGATEMEIEQVKYNMKKDLAMAGLQDAQTVFLAMSAHSKNAWRAYKATAIAETIISTLKSAQSSYEALAWIPLVGPALGIAAAAAALAMGYMRVQAIRSQERPTAAEGGVFSGPTAGYGATLHGTEAVVPLPNGRSIPVETAGGGGLGGGTLQVNIQAVDSQSFVDMAARNPQAIMGPLVEQLQLGNRNLISTMQDTTREE